MVQGETEAWPPTSSGWRPTREGRVLLVLFIDDDPFLDGTVAEDEGSGDGAEGVGLALLMGLLFFLSAPSIARISRASLAWRSRISLFFF